MLRTISSDLLALATASLSVRQRLDLPPGRCLACRDWPETMVTMDGDAMGASYAACHCGFSPTLIAIVLRDMPLPT